MQQARNNACDTQSLKILGDEYDIINTPTSTSSKLLITVVSPYQINGIGYGSLLQTQRPTLLRSQQIMTMWRLMSSFLPLHDSRNNFNTFSSSRLTPSGRTSTVSISNTRGFGGVIASSITIMESQHDFNHQAIYRAYAGVVTIGMMLDGC